MPPMIRVLAVAGGLSMMLWAESAFASCQPRLQNVAQRVSELPPGMSDALMDRLTLLYDEALEVESTEPARCLALVAQMEALLSDRSGRTDEATTSGGSAQNGRTYPGGQSTIERQDSSLLEEPEVLAVPPLVDTGARIRPSNAFTESVVNYWTGSSVWERGRLLAAANRYIDAVREAGEAVTANEDDEAERRRRAGAISETIHAIEVYQHVVLVNEPEDMLAARQADALRRLRDSARRALVQLIRGEADELIPPNASDESDELIPPSPPEQSDELIPPTASDDGDDLIPPSASEEADELISPSAAGNGDELIPPSGDDNSLTERLRRRIANADAFLREEVRKVAPWLEDRGGFVAP